MAFLKLIYLLLVIADLSLTVVTRCSLSVAVIVYHVYIIRWFSWSPHPVTGKPDWIYQEQYWSSDWSKCPDIF